MRSTKLHTQAIAHHGTASSPWQAPVWAILLLAFALAFALALGCGQAAENELVEIDPGQTERRDATFGRLLADNVNRLMPLETLTQQQREAVTALVTLMHAAALYESSALPKHEALTAMIDHAFSIIPLELRPIRQIGALAQICRDESKAFESAMTACRQENADAELPDCAESWAAGSEEISCTVMALGEIEHQTQIAGSRNLPPVAAPPPFLRFDAATENPTLGTEIMESDRFDPEVMESEIP